MEADISALEKSADQYAEKAEATSQLTFITKSNSFRRNAKEKKRPPLHKYLQFKERTMLIDQIPRLLPCSPGTRIGAGTRPDASCAAFLKMFSLTPLASGTSLPSLTCNHHPSKVGSSIPSLTHQYAEVFLGKMLNPEWPLIE
ncbi:unnamed protein product [Pleuronectes platessa]|uniref:Uncharacterized protein n=1 Tax=Pleuronectes platessa TaxID=8262 RepID=A0A9N7TQS0_PLEPL|nr:unnamed protein product [Pleuronectes platessa]